MWLDLGDVLQLVVDRLDQRPLAQEQFVGQGQELVLHILPKLGDEPQFLRFEQRRQRSADIALVTEEPAPQLSDQVRHGPPVIDVARRQVAAQKFAAVVDDQVEFEAVEPAHARLPALGRAAEDFMLRDAQVVADGQRGGVHEGDARAVAFARVQVAPKRDHGLALQLDEPAVADQSRERPGQALRDVARVEGLEVAVAGGVEQHEDGHHLGERERAGLVAAARAARQ